MNRIWQGHFGNGIVKTPENFGLLGAQPTHPELLDWLARTFTEQGWSVKKMHRLILLSNTYKMSTVADPKPQNWPTSSIRKTRCCGRCRAGVWKRSRSATPFWPSPEIST